MQVTDAKQLKDRERRKQLRLRLRADLEITPQIYEGRTYYVVKDPVGLQYWRFREQEYFILQLLDGRTTLDDAQKRYEKRFRPERITLEELEGFAQQVMGAGLARNDSPQLGKQLLERRGKRRRREWMQRFMNILAIKVPVFDPETLLTKMLRYTKWIFTTTFAALSVLVILAALFLVLTHFEQFRSKLPDYKEFFSPRNLLGMWLTLGIVKVIHEFGHGLSCKAFGGEVHEMGLLILCFSPSLYCNVSDAWTMPGKWRRIIISAAGIYVELMVAAIATFVWWNTTGSYFIHQLALSLMVVCSVSTVMFNGNPLLRYDGYHVMADFLEIPNLSQRSSQFLLRTVQEHCLGIEVQPEPYMETKRKVLFMTYAVTSYVYRWIVTFGIIWFFYQFLKPYKLGALGGLLAVAALSSMVGMPIYQLIESLRRRGRLPDMKQWRVTVSLCVLGVVVLLFFLLPLPVARVRQTGLIQVQPEFITRVFVPVPAIGERIPGVLEQVFVEDGQTVEVGYVLGQFRNQELNLALAEAEAQLEQENIKLSAAQELLNAIKDENERGRLRGDVARSRGEQGRLSGRVAELKHMKDGLTLRAPRRGTVLSPPRADEIGRQWDRDRTAPFCGIGDPTHLRVLVPVSTADYDLLKESQREAAQKEKPLNVDLRIHGRGADMWKGELAHLPQSDAREVPMALTNLAGGPVAARPPSQGSGGSGNAVPQVQQYLVAVDIVDPDGAVCPGMLAQVKIHCPWRPAAWWAWRSLSSTFDLGLL
jgi:putative peptide zinc metalloprotease protein